MKGRPNSGAMSSAPARACCRRRTRSTRSPRPPQPTAWHARPRVAAAGRHDQRSDHRRRAPQPWRSWQRSEDYYSEGQLIWIDVDRIIRQQSGGKRSIDDFARAFFGMRDRDYGELTYTLDDVVKTLNKVQPYDWRGYLQRQVYDIAAAAAARGHQRGRLQARLHRRADQLDQERARSRARTTTSLIRAGSSSAMTARSRSVLWDSPAFNAGHHDRLADRRGERPQLRRRRAEAGDQGCRRARAARPSC